MDVLVVGANGLLGSNVVAEALDRDLAVTAAYHSSPPQVDIERVQLDITDSRQIAHVLETTNPNVVVNCAAMTDVDACEDDPERAHDVNGRAPGRLAQGAEKRDIQFVQVSTDYVFAGRSSQRYMESDDRNPLQEYGQSKLVGENRVVESHSEPIIPRLSFVYGRRGDDGRLDGFPAWVQGRIESGKEVSLFTDQWITPTRAGHAARTILDLVREGGSGYYHVASQSCVTPFEFGNELAELLGRGDELLARGSLEDVDRPAPRPSNTCLDVEKVAATLGRPQPTLREDLESVMGAR